MAIKHTQATTVRPPRALASWDPAGGGPLVTQLLHSLPFALTLCQTQALADIRADLLSSTPMRRLVQGDVGSGKTLVGFGAALMAIEAGCQVAFIAPTEILARQHAAKLAPLCEGLGVRLGVCLGGQSRRLAGKAQRQALQAGELDLVVGTHALLEESVQFHNLGLAIVDEQHRFGVTQRLQLLEKNSTVDLLSMTATPIPRSLQLTVFGDMEVSLIRSKPPGRQPIITTLVGAGRLDEVIAGVRRHLAKGQQAYWVCPLVEESGAPEALNSDKAAAEARYAQLGEALGPEFTVGLVHGRLASQDKEAVMQAFVAGEVRLLVATTVIEVGVDVPQATLMVIDNSQRFGLAQLHQLRGRVGRGHAQSYCMLVYGHPLTATAQRRLSTLRDTEDGFLIAEEDLALRGGGDMYGTQQSGYNVFKLGDLRRDIDLLREARGVAKNFPTSPAAKEGEALLKMVHDRFAPTDYTQAG